MAGRIREEDIRRVREASPIEAIVGEHLQLRNAGGGNLKGLCPFHDERTPSFQVTPARGLYHCFGCQQGGDVFKFVMDLDHVGFTEAVERLAARANITLRYEQGGPSRAGEQSDRTRLLAVNRVTAEYFRAQLDTPGAEPGRRFLTERGFDSDAAARFGIGYAPQSWDSLVRHLRGRGFADTELVRAGVVTEGRRGPIDRFRGRLVWPIADITGDIIGFGARKLAADDQGPKYLNTPETPLYRKASVLYGLHLAKRDIVRASQAVIVEGYTDVMACHLAGVATAVATCGTAFGAEHIRVLRRLLDDREGGAPRGRVVFTFDGDAAGQQAALRAFAEDQRFVMQTFVAVQPDGLDPCDLRIAKGDAAVAALVDGRVPLFEFAIRAVLRRYDVETAEGRVAALAAAAPLVARIRDEALRPEYARRLAGWLGMDDRQVLQVVRQAARTAASADGRPPQNARGGPESAAPSTHGQRGPSQHADAQRRATQRPGSQHPASSAGAQAPAVPRPQVQVQREALKLALQWPKLAGTSFDSLEPEEFGVPLHAVIRRVIAAAGGTVAGAEMSAADWVAAVREQAPDDAVRGAITALAVEPPLCKGNPDDRYAAAQFARIREYAVRSRIADSHSRIQRLAAAGDEAAVQRTLSELQAMETYLADLGRHFGLS